MRLGLSAFAIAFAFTVCVAPAARADEATARDRFNEGVKRFQKGDFEGARVLFLEADREHHSPVIDYNLGLAEERLGHPQAAVDAYKRYLVEAGESGEFGPSAAVAIAQIEARSGRVRIESPVGARAFINGMPTRERTPTVVLVPPGHQLVVVEGDDYRVSTEIDVAPAATVPVSLNRPPPQTPPVDKPIDKPPPRELGRAPTDLGNFVWGATFQVVPYGFFKRTNKDPNEEGATGIFVGVSAEAGFAFTSRSVVGVRAFGSVGSECKGFFDSHIAAAGPALMIRALDDLWIGAGLYGGNGETCRPNDTGPVKHFSTDIVFSPVFDVSYAVTNRYYGQWLVSAGIGYFFATPSNDNRLIYAPVGFGPRFF